jgi:hypothetical protein
VKRGNTYYTFFIGATVGLLIAIVTMFRDCNKPTFTKGKPDTVTKVVTRPVTIRDTVRVKSVMVKYKDTTYFVERPVKIPCGDTAFIAQSDSVITTKVMGIFHWYSNRAPTHCKQLRFRLLRNGPRGNGWPPRLLLVWY